MLDPLIPVAKAEDVVEAFRRVKRMEQQVKRTKMGKLKQWNPPPNNWCKANVDATIDKENYKVGLGVIIRNAKGDIVAAAIKSSNFNG